MYRAASAGNEVGADGAIDAAADAEGVAIEVVEVAALLFEPGDEVVNVGGEVHGFFRVCLCVFGEWLFTYRVAGQVYVNSMWHYLKLRACRQ